MECWGPRWCESRNLLPIHDTINVDVGFLNDIRLTAEECEHSKRKIKGMFHDESFVATSAVLDPGTVNGKVCGQLVIVRAAWRTAVTDVVRDKPGLGGVFSHLPQDAKGYDCYCKYVLTGQDV